MKRLHLHQAAYLLDILRPRVEPDAVPQPVLGLQLRSPFRLRHNVERAHQARTCLPPEIAAQLTSLDVMDAKGGNPIIDVAVYRYRFIRGAPLTLDEIAEGSAEHLRCLPGVSGTRCTVRTLNVSGLDARWISFGADRWDERIGVEELGIFDPGTKTFWTVKTTCKRRAPLNWISAWALYPARANARRILASVSLVAAE